MSIFQIEQEARSKTWRIVMDCFVKLAHHVPMYVMLVTHTLFVERYEYRLLQR